MKGNSMCRPKVLRKFLPRYFGRAFTALAATTQEAISQSALLIWIKDQPHLSACLIFKVFRNFPDAFFSEGGNLLPASSIGKGRPRQRMLLGIVRQRNNNLTFKIHDPLV